jgi:competence protein ComEA
MKTFLILLLCCLGFSVQAAVNINTANQTELESLPGIGPVKAKAILEYRKKNGGFKSVDELTKVDGIGPVTLKNARNDIVLDASAATKSAPVNANPKSHADNKKALMHATPSVTALKTPIQPKPANQAIVVPAKPMGSPAKTKSATTIPSKLLPAKVSASGAKPSKSEPGKSNPDNLNPGKQQGVKTKPSEIKPSSQKSVTKKP